MMGKRQLTGSVFDVGNVFPFRPTPGSFHAQLAAAAPRLFRDETFVDLYDRERGRYSVPPSLLALLLLLQAQGHCSDAEAIERSACDLRWCAVLGKPAGEPLCVKSTLQLFRAQLILRKKDCHLKASLAEARRSGLIPSGELRVFIDTKPILGWGAVKDTYNLLGDAIRQLARALARATGVEVDVWVREQRLERYHTDRTSSLKGSADLDWTQAAVRQEFLREIVSAALRLSQVAGTWLAAHPERGPGETAGQEAHQRRRAVQEAREVLVQILGQDVTVGTDPDGGLTAELKTGTEPDRVCSTSDPEQRHGHQSKSRKFNGHKGRVASIRARRRVRLVLAGDVLPGNAGDAEEVLALVEAAEQNVEQPLGKTVGDCAFGGGATRAEFAAAGRVLIAKSPQPQAGERFPKSAFRIDLVQLTVTCPAGETCTEYRTGQDGTRHFRFGAVCGTCPLRAQCTTAKDGRTVQVHPQEALLTAAREYQQTPEGKAVLRERAAVEHVLGQLARLGAGQARYRGREKTRFQWLLAAAVVNLRQIWNAAGRGDQVGPTAGPGSPAGGPKTQPQRRQTDPGHTADAAPIPGTSWSDWLLGRSGGRFLQERLGAPPGWSTCVAR